MTNPGNQTLEIQNWLDRLQAGDEATRHELINCACHRLVWYQELSQAEAARLLGISERTLKRRWAAARLRLHDLLGRNLPGCADDREPAGTAPVCPTPSPS